MAENIFNLSNDIQIKRFSNSRKSISNGGSVRSEKGSPDFYEININLPPLTQEQYRLIKSDLLSSEDGILPYYSSVNSKINFNNFQGNLDPAGVTINDLSTTGNTVVLENVQSGSYVVKGDFIQFGGTSKVYQIAEDAQEIFNVLTFKIYGSVISTISNANSRLDSGIAVAKVQNYIMDYGDRGIPQNGEITLKRGDSTTETINLNNKLATVISSDNVAKTVQLDNAIDFDDSGVFYYENTPYHYSTKTGNILSDFIDPLQSLEELVVGVNVVQFINIEGITDSLSVARNIDSAVLETTPIGLLANEGDILEVDNDNSFIKVNNNSRYKPSGEIYGGKYTKDYLYFKGISDTLSVTDFTGDHSILNGNYVLTSDIPAFSGDLNPNSDFIIRSRQVFKHETEDFWIWYLNNTGTDATGTGWHISSEGVNESTVNNTGTTITNIVSSGTDYIVTTNASSGVVVGDVIGNSLTGSFSSVIAVSGLDLTLSSGDYLNIGDSILLKDFSGAPLPWSYFVPLLVSPLNVNIFNLPLKAAWSVVNPGVVASTPQLGGSGSNGFVETFGPTGELTLTRGDGIKESINIPSSSSGIGPFITLLESLSNVNNVTFLFSQFFRVEFISDAGNARIDLTVKNQSSQYLIYDKTVSKNNFGYRSKDNDDGQSLLDFSYFNKEFEYYANGNNNDSNENQGTLILSSENGVNELFDIPNNIISSDDFESFINGLSSDFIDEANVSNSITMSNFIGDHSILNGKYIEDNNNPNFDRFNPKGIEERTLLSSIVYKHETENFWAWTRSNSARDTKYSYMITGPSLNQPVDVDSGIEVVSISGDNVTFEADGVISLNIGDYITGSTGNYFGRVTDISSTTGSDLGTLTNVESNIIISDFEFNASGDWRELNGEYEAIDASLVPTFVGDFDPDGFNNATLVAGSTVYRQIVNPEIYIWNRFDTATTQGGWHISRTSARKIDSWEDYGEGNLSSPGSISLSVNNTGTHIFTAGERIASSITGDDERIIRSATISGTTWVLILNGATTPAFSTTIFIQDEIEGYVWAFLSVTDPQNADVINNGLNWRGASAGTFANLISFGFFSTNAISELSNTQIITLPGHGLLTGDYVSNNSSSNFTPIFNVTTDTFSINTPIFSIGDNVFLSGNNLFTVNNNSLVISDELKIGDNIFTRTFTGDPIVWAYANDTSLDNTIFNNEINDWYIVSAGEEPNINLPFINSNLQTRDFGAEQGITGEVIIVSNFTGNDYAILNGTYIEITDPSEIPTFSGDFNPNGGTSTIVPGSKVYVKESTDGLANFYIWNRFDTNTTSFSGWTISAPVVGDTDVFVYTPPPNGTGLITGRAASPSAIPGEFYQVFRLSARYDGTNEAADFFNPGDTITWYHPGSPGGEYGETMELGLGTVVTNTIGVNYIIIEVNSSLSVLQLNTIYSGGDPVYNAPNGAFVVKKEFVNPVYPWAAMNNFNAQEIYPFNVKDWVKISPGSKATSLGGVYAGGYTLGQYYAFNFGGYFDGNYYELNVEDYPVFSEEFSRTNETGGLVTDSKVYKHSGLNITPGITTNLYLWNQFSSDPDQGGWHLSTDEPIIRYFGTAYDVFWSRLDVSDPQNSSPFPGTNWKVAFPQVLYQLTNGVIDNFIRVASHTNITTNSSFGDGIIRISATENLDTNLNEINSTIIKDDISNLEIGDIAHQVGYVIEITFNVNAGNAELELTRPIRRVDNNFSGPFPDNSVLVGQDDRLIFNTEIVPFIQSSFPNLPIGGPYEFQISSDKNGKNDLLFAGPVWGLIIDPTTISLWQPNTFYSEGSLVRFTDNENIYQALVNFTSGATLDTNNWVFYTNDPHTDNVICSDSVNIQGGAQVSFSNFTTVGNGALYFKEAYKTGIENKLVGQRIISEAELFRVGNDVQFKLQLENNPVVSIIPGPGFNYYQYDTIKFKEIL